MVMDLGPNGKHVAGCHDRFRYEDVSAAGGTSFAGRPHPSHTLVGFTIRTEDDIITSLKFICGWCQPKRGVQNRGGCAFIRSRTRQNAKRIFSRAYALGSSHGEEPKNLHQGEKYDEETIFKRSDSVGSVPDPAAHGGAGSRHHPAINRRD